MPADSGNLPFCTLGPYLRGYLPGGNAMSAVNAGGRLDRLPLSSFHRRIFFLIGAGMFFDGYDLYVGTTVLGATVQSGFSTLNQNAQFVSATFFGMTLGSLITGFLGDRYGRRFTYQVNLLMSLRLAFKNGRPSLNSEDQTSLFVSTSSRFYDSFKLIESASSP